MSSAPTAKPFQEKWILLSTILASSMAFIDSSALNVALPAIQRALDVKGTGLLWIVNAYTLFLSALLLVGGALGDQYGRNRVFGAGIILFAVSSLACGLAPSPTFLITARIAQGVGGALMVPGSLSIITALFPANKRGRAIGTWSMFSALTTVLGPVLGGWLAGIGWWRAVFFINIPLAGIALYAMSRFPESRASQARPLDLNGAVLATLGMGLLTYGFIQGSEAGWEKPRIIAGLSTGALALITFIWWELRTSHPMMRPRLFSIRTFTVANAQTLLIYASLGGMLFFIPLNLVQVQGYSEQQTGLAMLPFALLISGLSRLSGSWVDRVGARPPLLLGPLICAVGYWFLGRTGLTSGPAQYWSTFFPALLALGAGMGITVAPLTTAVMGAVPDDSTGAASGINNTFARMSTVLAIAILGAIALTGFRQNLEEETANLSLSPAVQQALEQEAEKLAEAQPPASAALSKEKQIQQAIDRSFVRVFQQLSWIAAGLCLLGASLSYWLKPTKKDPEGD